MRRWAWILARVRFTAHFGRNMEYYTGFVFELWSRDAEGPVQVAGGGRYDTLMEMLGARRRSAPSAAPFAPSACWRRANSREAA